jgi:hypothetical protein
MTQTNEAASQHPLVAQQQEQITALATDGEQAAAREQKARESFQTVCGQAAQALSMPPTSPQGQILAQALVAAYQWGLEAADAGANVAQRREEVAAMQQFVKSQIDALKDQAQRREKDAEASMQRLALLERIAKSQEGMLDKITTVADLLTGIGDLKARIVGPD